MYDRVNEIAARKGCTPGQVALAWLHHKGSDVCPLPGTTKVENFDQNIGALSLLLVYEQAMKGGMREKVELATKFGITFHGKIEMHGDPGYVRAACESSLKQLGIDCIDLYYQHRVDIRVPIEVTVRPLVSSFLSSGKFCWFTYSPMLVSTMCKGFIYVFIKRISPSNVMMGELKKLVEEGKIKYVGLSEVCASTIRRAHAVHPVTAIQLEWSLWSRDVEEEIVPTCRELGIGIVAYSPLGLGFFASGAKLIENLATEDFRK
ncbi:hypothetical protein C3L33_15224, partial [Rhododendron williamsianum]